MTTLKWLVLNPQSIGYLLGIWYGKNMSFLSHLFVTKQHPVITFSKIFKSFYDTQHSATSKSQTVKQVDSTTQQKPLPLKDTHYFANHLHLTALQWIQLNCFTSSSDPHQSKQLFLSRNLRSNQMMTWFTIMTHHRYHTYPPIHIRSLPIRGCPWSQMWSQLGLLLNQTHQGSGTLVGHRHDHHLFGVLDMLDAGTQHLTTGTPDPARSQDHLISFATRKRSPSQRRIIILTTNFKWIPHLW